MKGADMESNRRNVMLAVWNVLKNVSKRIFSGYVIS